jgi:hypothetical protein
MTMNTGAGVADFDVRPQRAELASGVRSRAAANHLAEGYFTDAKLALAGLQGGTRGGDRAKPRTCLA